jgi:hypothetical protein
LLPAPGAFLQHILLEWMCAPAELWTVETQPLASTGLDEGLLKWAGINPDILIGCGDCAAVNVVDVVGCLSFTRELFKKWRRRQFVTCSGKMLGKW